MDVLIRNLSDETIEEFSKQAADNNRPVADELKAILDAMADYRRSRSFDSTDLIHQMRNGCEWCK